MSASSSVGNFDLNVVQLRKPLEFPDATIQTTAYIGSSTNLEVNLIENLTNTTSINMNDGGNSIELTGFAINNTGIVSFSSNLNLNDANATIEGYGDVTILAVGSDPGTGDLNLQAIVDINLQYTDLTITTGALPNTAGASSGLYLPITINGTAYKISLDLA